MVTESMWFVLIPTAAQELSQAGVFIKSTIIVPTNNDWRVKLTTTHPLSRGYKYGLYHKANLFMFCFFFQ